MSSVTQQSGVEDKDAPSPLPPLKKEKKISWGEGEGEKGDAEGKQRDFNLHVRVN